MLVHFISFNHFTDRGVNLSFHCLVCLLSFFTGMCLAETHAGFPPSHNPFQTWPPLMMTGLTNGTNGISKLNNNKLMDCVYLYLNVYIYITSGGEC